MKYLNTSGSIGLCFFQWQVLRPLPFSDIVSLAPHVEKLTVALLVYKLTGRLVIDSLQLQRCMLLCQLWPLVKVATPFRDRAAGTRLQKYWRHPRFASPYTYSENTSFACDVWWIVTIFINFSKQALNFFIHSPQRLTQPLHLCAVNFKKTYQRVFKGQSIWNRNLKAVLSSPRQMFTELNQVQVQWSFYGAK